MSSRSAFAPGSYSSPHLSRIPAKTSARTEAWSAGVKSRTTPRIIADPSHTWRQGHSPARDLYGASRTQGRHSVPVGCEQSAESVRAPFVVTPQVPPALLVLISARAWLVDRDDRDRRLPSSVPGGVSQAEALSRLCR